MVGLVINRVGKIADFGHKWGKGFGKRAAHPTQFFWEYPPPPPGIPTESRAVGVRQDGIVFVSSLELLATLNQYRIVLKSQLVYTHDLKL